MAKKTEELAKQDALETIPDDLMRDAGKGTENIGTEDVKPPRILLCQSGSPQRKPDDPKQIPGLNELDMFNDLSGEIYGRGPLNFVVISAMRPRYIEFIPMEEGGGIKDFDVKPTDPRTQWTVAPDGTRQKPVATMFRDYLVWLPDHQEMAVLSMKSTQLKVAVQLNGKMKLPLKIGNNIIMDPPAWARTFSLTTTMQKDKNYAWGGYNLKIVGVTPPDVREQCAALAEMYSRKNIVIEREPGDDSFDAGAMEGETTSSAATEM